MPPIDTLKLWFERDISLATWRDVEIIVDQTNVAEIRFTNNRFAFTITADINHGESYLGCVMWDKTRRAGRDLPDGTFSQATWREIVESINEWQLDQQKPLPGRLF